MIYNGTKCEIWNAKSCNFLTKLHILLSKYTFLYFFTFLRCKQGRWGFISKLSISIFQITSNWLNQLLLPFLSLSLWKILSLYWAKVQLLLHTISATFLGRLCRFESDLVSSILAVTLKFHLMFWCSMLLCSSLNAQSNMK